MHIGGAKNGTPATHPLSGREMRELRRHQRESAPSPFVFVSKRGAPLSAPGFSRMIERAANSADLGIKATCCAMLAATSSPTMATTRARSKPISGIATFRTRRATPPWRRIGLRNSFEIDPPTKRGKGSAPNAPFDSETAVDSFWLLPLPPKTERTHQRLGWVRVDSSGEVRPRRP
jgi:hypothetical protein